MNDTTQSSAIRAPVWANRVMRLVMFLAAFLVPLFYFPFTTDPLLAKVALIEIIALVLAVAWLVRSLLAKRLAYKRMPLNAALALAAIALVIATISADAPWSGVFGNDPTGEKAATLLSFFVVAFVTAAVFERGDAYRALRLVIVSFALLGIFTAASVAAGRAGVSVPSWLAVNPVGTINALALVLATGLIVSATFAWTGATSAGRRMLSRRVRFFAGAVAILLFLVLLAVGFPAVWYGLAITLALLVSFVFTRAWRAEAGERDAPNEQSGGEDSNSEDGPPSGGDGSLGVGVPTRLRVEHAMGPAAAAAAFLLLAASVLLAVKPPAFLGRIAPRPIEVSPSLGLTMAIDGRVLRADPLFGVGPANFRTAFTRFRDTAFNQSAFWQVRFPHGFSFASTLPATLGAIGAIAFLAVAVAALGLIGRGLWTAGASDPYLWALGAGSVFVLIEWFLYAGNATASFLLFLFLGLLAAAVRESGVSGGAPQEGREGRPSWWRITRRSITVEAPALNFITSLVTIFVAAFALVALYGVVAAYAADVYARRATDVFVRFGNTDTAGIFFDRASALNPNDVAHRLGRAQSALAAVNRIIAQAASNPTPDLPDRFRSEFSAGVAAATAAAELAPDDPQPWVIAGSLYETAIPFLPGADRAAQDAYERASRLDPLDPLVKFSRARAFATAADAASLQAAQVGAEERRRLEGASREALAAARGELQAAIGLKSDYAAAHFLLTQVYLREGNTDEAIRRAEATAALAPGDIGVAFQLGFLYYRSGEFAKAEREFGRAVLINENYSNARYFLGLIYDLRGDGERALAEFRRIEGLNPDNAEVRRIIANLESGRRALDGIAPPPEERREAPVPEGRERPRERR